MTNETQEQFQKRMEMSRYYRGKSKKALRNMLIGFGISIIIGGYSSIKVDSLKKENPDKNLEYKCRENKESHVCQYSFPPKNEVDFYKTGLLLGMAGGLISLVLGGGASMYYNSKGIDTLLNKKE